MGGAIAQSLALREPKYQETAAYCHFGREPYTKNGIKFFEWENAKDLAKYKGMSSEQVSAALKGSNYLTKWVDWSGIVSKCAVPLTVALHFAGCWHVDSLVGARRIR